MTMTDERRSSDSLEDETKIIALEQEIYEATAEIAEFKTALEEAEREIEDARDEAANQESIAEGYSQESWILHNAMESIVNLTRDFVPTYFRLFPDPAKLLDYYETLEYAHRLAKDALDAYERGM